MSFNAFNAPFWDFFDNISDEVNQFNRLLQTAGYDNNRVRVVPSKNKTVTQNGETPSASADGQVSNVTGTDRSLGFPSLFNSSFFNSSFDFVPPVDILDNEKEYEIHVSTPGVKKDDIQLDFHPENNEVVISGVLKGHSEHSSKNLKVQERSSGEFKRRIALPTSTKLDEDNIKASYNNGVLVLKVPKLDASTGGSKRIEISASDSLVEGGDEKKDDKQEEKSS
ncbi:CYFA0S06e04038g1_1 [Cyberlindnera fabianii]|uniref:CYFA0S06e04038g1_1 n=1 Tax=Cyberlindnera fabianii TaxID=36022 RepID=A0A061B0N8_CYBFA|nr:Heat shock protein 26 [Cyberlindnera fabianii]CDR41212.1 CYFA0S06e04038g1_1 [Cyberlindnera fabianii]